MSLTVRELIRTGAISSRDATIAGAVAGGLIVLLLVFVFTVDAGMRRKRDELNQRIAAKMNELEAAEQLASRESDLKTELRDVQDVVAKFEAKLPTRRELPKLYREWQEAAGQAGVTGLNIRKQDEIEGTTLVTVPYAFAATGSYHQLATFINMLECGNRFMKVSKLHIGEQENGVSNAEFTLSTYLFKEREEVGG